jgi:hypothetical protein
MKGRAMHTQQPLAKTELLQAHRSLLQELCILDKEASSPAAAANVDWGRRLAAVRALLNEHFRFEERDGYLDAVRKREPRLEHSARELLDEHRDLELALGALIAEATTGTSVADTFRTKIQQWIKKVRSHESKENLLVEDAFKLDIGFED